MERPRGALQGPARPRKLENPVPNEGVHVAQWAKRPPLKLEVPGSSPRGWFNGRAGNRDL